MTRDNLLVWLAGFFDGEGCIMVTDYWRKTKSGTPRYSTQIFLTIRQCDRAPLDIIENLTGVGQVRPRKLTENKPNWRPQFEWVVCGNKKVKRVLDLIRPFSILKSPQIDIFYELYSTFGYRGHTGNKLLSGETVDRRRELVARIRGLKKSTVSDSYLSVLSSRA